MEYYKPTLESERHHYPFLQEYVFQSGGAVEAKIFLGILARINRKIFEDAAKRGIGEVMKKLDCDGMFFVKSEVDSLVPELQAGKEVQIKIPSADAKLCVKRFGDCAGVHVVDHSGKKHDVITGFMEELAQSSGYGLYPFFHRHSITMRRWHAYGNNVIDVQKELESAAQRVPDVTWREDAGLVAAELANHYILDGKWYGGSPGVCVGEYHDIDVHMQVLFGSGNLDENWRRGATRRERAILNLEANSSENPCVRYVVSTVDENNMFKSSPDGINYVKEQRLLRQLANILYHAFDARYQAESIVQSPYEAEWRKPAAA